MRLRALIFVYQKEAHSESIESSGAVRLDFGGHQE